MSRIDRLLRLLDFYQQMHELFQTVDNAVLHHETQQTNSNQNNINFNENELGSNNLTESSVQQSQNVPQENELLYNNYLSQEQSEINQEQQSFQFQSSQQNQMNFQIHQQQHPQNQQQNEIQNVQQNSQQEDNESEQQQDNNNDSQAEDQEENNANNNQNDHSTNNNPFHHDFPSSSLMGLFFEGFVITNRLMLVSFRVRNPFQFGSNNDEPVQKEVLDQIPVIEINEANLQEFCDEQCSICFENFKSEETLIKTHCNHQFHKNCIQKWFDAHNTCPVCRQKISKITKNEKQKSETENLNENQNDNNVENI